jgi:iron complex outermembrane receptor protein
VFPGFRPSDESDKSRLSEAVYAGLETQPTKRTNVDLGARYEHYSDFGNTLTGKLAGRVAVFHDTDNELALRGSASTGFRAPGLQQLWYSTIATQFFNDPATGTATPTNILISPNRSAVTEAFGVPHLKEETSVNFSGGFTARLFSNLALSADYYRVSIQDRVVLTALFDTGDAVLGDAISAIVAPFPGVGSTQFFVNSVNTTTNGVDIVLDYSYRLPNGQLKLTAAANFTSTAVDEVNVPQSMLDKFAGIPGGAARVSELFLGRYGRNRLEDLQPRQKATLGLRWDRGPFAIGLRGNFFGPTEYRSDSEVDGVFLDESFGAKATLDVDLSYRMGKMLWSIGGNNVFNTFPDEVQRPDNRNNESFLYSPVGNTAGAPYGIDGAFFFARAQYRY